MSGVTEVLSQELRDSFAEMKASIAEIQKNIGQNKFATEDEIKRLMDEHMDSRSKKDTEERETATSLNQLSHKNARKVYETVLGQVHAEDSELGELQRHSDHVYILSSLTRTDPRELKTYGKFEKSLKVLDSVTSGSGADFVPRMLSNRLQMRVRLSLQVANLFEDFEMPTQPYDWPLEGDDTEAYLVGQRITVPAGSTTILESTPGTGQITFSAVKLAAKTHITEEADEDSIIPVMGFVENKMVLAQRNAVEDAIINGDDSATHQDASVTNGNDKKRAWEGLRRVALQNPSAQVDLSTFSETGVRTLRQAMDKFGADATQLSIIASVNGWHQFTNLAQVITVDKYGAGAQILTGEVAKFDGIPIILSEFQRNDLDSAGVNTAPSDSRTAINMVRRDQFAMGRRRGITVKSGELIEADQTMIVSHQRIHFRHVNEEAPTTAGGAVIAALGYNIPTVL